jgi:hypothetical protein
LVTIDGVIVLEEGYEGAVEVLKPFEGKVVTAPLPSDDDMRGTP